MNLALVPTLIMYRANTDGSEEKTSARSNKLWSPRKPSPRTKESPRKRDSPRKNSPRSKESPRKRGSDKKDSPRTKSDSPRSSGSLSPRSAREKTRHASPSRRYYFEYQLAMSHLGRSPSPKKSKEHMSKSARPSKKHGRKKEYHTFDAASFASASAPTLITRETELSARRQASFVVQILRFFDESIFIS